MQSQNQQQQPPKKSRVDDILIGMATDNKELINPKPPVEDIGSKETGSEPIDNLSPKETINEENEKPKSTFEADKKAHQEKERKQGKKPTEPDAVPSEKPTEPEPLPAAAKQVSEVDDYGIPAKIVKEEKKYTDSDMQRMIRERLDRVKQNLTPEQVKEAAQEFKAANPDATVEQWEKELDDHVGKVIEKREQKARQIQMQSEENKIQADFEKKFTDGMGKYDNFWEEVNKVAITPTMMIATRAMENPAGFLYAAAKLQPAELTRIAKMTDAAAQLVEIGRLEERMLKASRATKAARPLEKMRGDDFEPDAEPKKELSIEERIAQHAKAKKGIK